ncbi:DUF2162 family putative transporter [Methanosphaera cuniculi]|uniref:Uncharacterized protein n=1 Tax=Methanosphaera cuniculi TaxID=1077256 RepID=A0A2A2HE64_9EURY|nr:DUF2162 family putative transporter [Methanosphaera cuniculi]PAV07596.1 hypothetical protein ASJ82_07940 [Methanosphaera cuniculi]PWL08081.1 hypothetical protein MSCUN_10120 [Methanosphaera cuniculi]
MNIINILCQFNLIISILIFGVNIALVCALAKLSKKITLTIALLYALGVFIISVLTTTFTQQLLPIIGENNQIILLIVSVFLLVVGVDTIHEWRTHSKNTIKSIKQSIIAPAPCFLLIIIETTLSMNTTLNDEITKFYLACSITLLIIIIVGYFIVKHTKAKHNPYQITLGNYMTYAGIYFLIEALLIPELTNIGSKQYQQITIIPESLTIMCIFTLILLIIGIIIGKKNNIQK